MKVGGKTAQEIFGSPQASALADAAATGNVGEVERLIRAGVPVDSLGYKNFTPLTFSLLAPNLKGMRALLENGANPNHRIDDLTSINGFPIIMFLGHLDQAQSLQLLLRYGANPNTRQPVRASTAAAFPYEGDSLLIESVMQIENVKVLVEHGADVNFRPQSNPGIGGGNTAATVAAGLGQFDVLEFLLDHGANVDLDRTAHYLQIRTWAPDARNRRIRILRRLHSMGAHIYGAFRPILSSKLDYYNNADTPKELISPGYYEPKRYLDDTPVLLKQ